MINKIYKIFASSIILVFLFSFSLVVYAQNDVSLYCDPAAQHSNPNSFWPLIQCGNAYNEPAYPGDIPTPQRCCDFTEASILVSRLVNWFLSISGTIAAITFAIAGAQMLMNPDNPGKRDEAKEMFKKTVIGLFIVLGAWLVVHTVISKLVSDPNSALRFFK